MSAAHAEVAQAKAASRVALRAHAVSHWLIARPAVAVQNKTLLDRLASAKHRRTAASCLLPSPRTPLALALLRLVRKDHLSQSVDGGRDSLALDGQAAAVASRPCTPAALRV